MRNKTVRHRHSACRRVISSLDPRLIVNLARRLVTNLAEVAPAKPEALTFSEVLTLLGARLELERRRLADAAMQQQLCEGDLRRVRRQRDRAANELRPKLCGIRRIVISLFGDAGVERFLGGMSRVPQDLPALVAFGKIVFRQLLQDPDDLPESRIAQVSLRPRAMAASIEPPLLALDIALECLQTLEGGHHSCVSTKNAALDRCEALLRPTERLLQDLRQLADAPLS